MDPQRWLDEVRKELQTRRLPRRYVTRLMRELSDHVMDGWENTMNKDVRVFAGPNDQLGSPGQIADTAEKEFRSRRFAARFPLLTFGLLPVLAFPIVAALTFLGPGWVIVELEELVGYFLGWDESALVANESDFGAWLPVAMKCYTAGTIILAAALVVWAMSRLARRAGVTAKWPIASAVLVAALAGCLWSDATPKTKDKQGMLMVGLGYPMRSWTIYQTAQLMMPLSFGIWLTRQRRRLPAAPSELARAA
ncbi:hypothetical protein AYO47_01750 [Planctomyces sp. SCGC AG-212-M04]|nr:hypothetical protein AYO47_01750 [Planctomyces sp. SCGC AG-212-M04]